MVDFKKLIVASLAIPVILMFTGCSSIAEKATEKAIEKSTGVKVDENNKSIKIKTDKGEAELKAEENKLPADFPKDFPIYTDAKIAGSIKQTAQGKQSYIITLETQDSPSKVFEFYKAELPKNGYEVSSTMEAGEGGSIGIKKDGKDIAGMMVAKDDKKTGIVITYGEQ